MKNFNASRWALDHKSLVVYFMLIIALVGMLQYHKLGREEDPPFTIKTMVVKTLWPGATTPEVVKQVTDRIEKKLEELPNLDYLKSYSKPGESVVFVNLKDSTRASDVPDLWYQVRKKVGDIKQTLPQGVRGRSLMTSSGTPTRSFSRSPRMVLDSASCAIMPSACAPNSSACLTCRKSTSSVLRTKRSTWSSPRNSSPPWGSTFPS